ncbi:MAG: proton-conducting transporter membrane subunit [Kiritimatiellia bacterium]|nr:proton-conducting transporter membrane subunit [Kiritimatiellia bacterium]
MNTTMILWAILMPAMAGLVILALGRLHRVLRTVLVLSAAAVNLAFAIRLFGNNAQLILPWAPFGMDFSLRLYNFSGFNLLVVAGFCLAICLYCIPFMATRRYAGQFYVYLFFSIAMMNGAVLADNLVLLIFFWEGLLLTLFSMITIGSPHAYRTAVKALIIVGGADLCLMFGIALCGKLAGTLAISQISLPLTPLGGTAFIFLMIGAIAKGGAIPFHTWIPDAAIDAPLPFMALVPAALDKLLGIYFLTRICLDMFQLTVQSPLTHVMMIIGAVTILVAVMMALIQTDYKKLLAYHAVSQMGYMILGIGTATPIGIVGGIFHMINNAIYKCCLFLTGGAVEKQAGTTDLKKLGGLAKGMPITFLCFAVAAVSISGVPPFNGFFSKELVYDGALARGQWYYWAALAGSFLTAASFLKLGHSAFLGKRPAEMKQVKEAPLAMLLPMIFLAGLCVVFGIYNALPLRKLIQPILGSAMAGHDFSGWPESVKLVTLTVAVLVLALLNHLYGVWKTGRGIGAVDHIHYAPVLSGLYAKAERRVFDPYEIGLRFCRVIASSAWAIDRAINWISDSFATGLSLHLARWISNRHSGSYAVYLLWSVAGITVLILWIALG